MRHFFSLSNSVCGIIILKKMKNLSLLGNTWAYIYAYVLQHTLDSTAEDAARLTDIFFNPATYGRKCRSSWSPNSYFGGELRQSNTQLSQCWSLKVVQPSPVCRLAQCARRARASTADKRSKKWDWASRPVPSIPIYSPPPRCRREMGLRAQIVFTMPSA